MKPPREGQALELVPRRAAATLRRRLSTFRGVVLQGPRQAGKSTLVRHGLEPPVGRYVSLDDPQMLAVARQDPEGLARLDRPLVIDEVQRGGEPLLTAIKRVLDDTDERGGYVLTGSSDFLATTSLRESLAGRVGFVDLLPLSVGEVLGHDEGFLDVLHGGPDSLRAASSPTSMEPEEYARLIERGGYPEVVTAVPPADRVHWFHAYVTSVVGRDVRALSRIHHPRDLERLLRGLCAMSSSVLDLSSLASDMAMNRQTARNYLDLLATVFLVRELPAWSTNALSRVSKTPKVHVVDSGLACALLGWDRQRLADPTFPAAGGLWETFAVGEIAKQASWADDPPRLYHLRDHGGRHEVDVVLEWRSGEVAGIEIKRSRSVSRSDLGGLAWMRDRLGDRFLQGVVLYGGADVLPFGDRLTAAPIASLWTAS